MTSLLLVACSRDHEPPPEPKTVVEPEPEVVPAPAPTKPAPAGLSYQRERIGEIDVEVFVADLRHQRLVALDARTEARTAARVDTLRAESGASVVVNGTFFDRDGKPLGLLQQGEVESSPLRDADWGVLEVDGSGRARLVHTRDYEPSVSVEFAVQCGPRVVIEGQVPKLKPQTAHRTALCLRSPHEVALLVTRGPVLADVLGSWLADELGCTDALLLDGGPSTQLSASFGEIELEVTGGWGVPNAVGIRDR